MAILSLTSAIHICMNLMALWRDNVDQIENGLEPTLIATVGFFEV